MLVMPASLITLLLLNGVFALIAIAVGFGAGWWVFAKRGSQSTARQQEVLSSERAMMAAGQIQDLTARVTQDVGAHSHEVERLSAELNEITHNGGESDADAVSEAIDKIVDANEALQNQLEQAEQKLEEQAKEIESHQSAALTDSLTGLNNRRAFDAEMKRRYSEWQRKETSVSLMILDIDHFKKFNDTHGHLAGDEVLRFVGKALTKATREMDVPCRYGGEEFAVILPDTSIADAKQAVERIRKTIEAMNVSFGDKTLKVTASVGMAEITKQDSTALLVRRADDALYASKEAGRNCGHFQDGNRNIPITPGTKTSPPRKSATKKPLQPIKVLNDLPNHAAFQNEVGRRASESHRYNVAMSVLVVAVNNYQAISKKHGPKAAVVLLDSVAQFLKSTIRDMDLLGRQGSDRFAVMLPGSSFDEASLVEQRIETALSNCVIPIGSEKIKIAISTGLAQLEPTQTAEELVLTAEQKATRGEAEITDESELADTAI